MCVHHRSDVASQCHWKKAPVPLEKSPSAFHRPCPTLLPGSPPAPPRSPQARLLSASRPSSQNPLGRSPWPPRHCPSPSTWPCAGHHQRSFSSCPWPSSNIKTPETASRSARQGKAPTVQPEARGQPDTGHWLSGRQGQLGRPSAPPLPEHHSLLSPRGVPLRRAALHRTPTENTTAWNLHQRLWD